MTRGSLTVRGGARGAETVRAAVLLATELSSAETLPQPADDGAMLRADEHGQGYRMVPVALMDAGSSLSEPPAGAAEYHVTYRGSERVEAYFHVGEAPKGGWVVDYVELCPK